MLSKEDKQMFENIEMYRQTASEHRERTERSLAATRAMHQPRGAQVPATGVGYQAPAQGGHHQVEPADVARELNHHPWMRWVLRLAFVGLVAGGVAGFAIAAPGQTLWLVIGGAIVGFATPFVAFGVIEWLITEAIPALLEFVFKLAVLAAIILAIYFLLTAFGLLSE